MKEEVETFIHVSEEPEDIEEHVVIVDVVIIPYPDIDETIVGYGNLDRGFDLGIYLTDSYINEVSHILVGHTIYSKVDWSVVIPGLNFFITKCATSCGENPLHSIDIIKVSLISGVSFELFSFYVSS